MSIFSAGFVQNSTEYCRAFSAVLKKDTSLFLLNKGRDFPLGFAFLSHFTLQQIDGKITVTAKWSLQISVSFSAALYLFLKQTISQIVISPHPISL